MSDYENDVIGGFNKLIFNQRKIDTDNTVVTTYLFDKNCQKLHDRINLQALKPITSRDYFSGSGTALFDAVYKAVTNIKIVCEHTQENHFADKVLFFIIACGIDDCSKYVKSIESLKNIIVHETEVRGWNFFFYCKDYLSKMRAEQIGIIPENIAWISGDFSISRIFSKINMITSEYRYPYYIRNELQPEGNETDNNEIADDSALKTLRKHWREKAVITNFSNTPFDKKKDIWCDNFEFGYYTIAKAVKLHAILDNGTIIPVDNEDDEYSDNEDVTSYIYMVEISVKRSNQSDDDIQLICKLPKESENCNWTKKITSLLIAKENEQTPDEYASLFIGCLFVDDSHTVEEWYRFSPLGEISKLSLDPSDMEIDNRIFK